MRERRGLENSVLQCVLHDPHCLEFVLDILDGSEFKSTENRAVFSAMIELFRSGKTPYAEIIYGKLQEKNLHRKMGTYLSGLLDESFTAAPALEYARELKERSRKDSMEGLCVELKTAIQQGDKERFQEIKKQIESYSEQDIGGTSHIRDLLDLSMPDIQKRISNPEQAPGVGTGLRSLDRITGGWLPATLVILGARPSIGKTSLGLNFATHAAVRESVRVSFLSLEMSRDEVLERCIRAEGRIPETFGLSGDTRAKHREIADNVAAALSDAPFWINDFSSGKRESESILEWAASNARAHRTDIVLIDYLQLMYSAKKSENRNNELARICGELKGFAKEHDCCVILLSQLSRMPEHGDKRPELFHLRDSGAIEQDADLVLLLHEPGKLKKQKDAEYQPTDHVIVSIAKNRNGPRGEITLAFKREYFRFEELDRGHGEVPF